MFFDETVQTCCFSNFQISDAIFGHDEGKCLLDAKAAKSSPDCSYESIVYHLVIPKLLRLDEDPKFCLAQYDAERDSLHLSKIGKISISNQFECFQFAQEEKMENLVL